MLDTVCVYNNKVFIPHPNATLVSFEYSKFKDDNCTQTFKESSKLKLLLPSDFRLKRVFLDVVENYSVGLKCMIVLAISIVNEVCTFMYCETLKNSLFRVKDSGWSKYSDIQPSNVFITHGPTLMFFLDDVLQIHSLSHNTRQYAALRTIFSVTSDSTKVLQFTYVGQLNKCDPVVVILLILARVTAINKEIYIISLGINIKQNNVPVIHNQLSTSLFFPKCFHNILQTVHVTNVKIPENSISSIKDLNWKDNYSFVATRGECMVFSNGILKYITKLPFSDILSIRTDFCDLPLEKVNLILVSESENVCLITNADFLDSSFGVQLNKTWSSIKSVLCGDILLNGRKHLLLLKDTTLDLWQNSCIVSDISSSNPVDIISQTSESDTSMSRAVPGLLTRVQRGKLNVVEAESKISKKIEATLDALFRVKEFGLDDENKDHFVPSFQNSLMDIILHKDENCQQEKDALKRIVSLNVLNHWVRLIDGISVFCWSLRNNDERTIFNPTMIILNQNQQVQCVQKLFVHKYDTFSIEDDCRKQINPGEKFFLVVSLEVPEFHSRDIEIIAILSWYVGSSSEFENELYLPLEKKSLIQQQMNLRTVVSASDFFRAHLKDICSIDDLMCMKVMQQRIILTVSSLYSDVTDFENFLLNSAYGLTHLLLLKSSNTKSLIFKSANLPLYGVHMIFNTLNSKTLEINAYTKNDKEAYLLVQFLYQYFPEDILILPSGISANEKEQLKQQAVCAMKDEVDLLLSTFNIHNCVEKINQEKVQVISEPGTIVIPKETFLRIRKIMVKKECITDNIMRTLNSAKYLTKIM